MKLNTLTAHELINLLSKRTISHIDICNDIINRIEKTEKNLNALAHFDQEKALERCNKLKEDAKKGDLWGIPIFIKDNISVKDELTTCSSKILKGFKPPYNATVIEKLIDLDAVLMGKTNMDEFAFGSSTETSCYGPTRNPWDLEIIPGGSSGGSAAAVSADEAIFALGSDTGGSIRQPASLCGVVGLKPTYGRVSRYGLVAFASSLDQIGPITKNVMDAALMLNVIAGHDPLDSTSAPVGLPDFAEIPGKDIKGLKMGIPKEYFIEGIDRNVADSVNLSIKKLESLGAVPVEVSLPHTGFAIAAYYILATSEASSNLARYDGVKYGLREAGKDLLEMYFKTRAKGFGAEVKRRIMLGTYALSSGYYEAYYKKAQQARTLIKQDFDNVFKNVDVIITPTSPSPAFKIGEKATDPLQMYLSDIFTISVNLAGVPAISIPCGFTKDNLPVGLQIIGRHFDEESILKAAYAYEQSTEWHVRKPSL